jgi:hypothetical protein
MEGEEDDTEEEWEAEEGVREGRTTGAEWGEGMEKARA